MNTHAHAPGFYKAYPGVTWDIAEDRWLETRCDVLYASCLSCGWTNADHPDEESCLRILAKPERMRVTEWLVASQHGYECPGEPEISFKWFFDHQADHGYRKIALHRGDRAPAA